MRVSVSGRQFVFPQVCVCCGAAASTTLGVLGTEKNKNSRTKGWSWQLPYCLPCAQHVRRYENYLLASMVSLALALPMLVLAVGWFDNVILFVASGLFLLVGTLSIVSCMTATKSSGCQSRGRSALYRGSDGSCHTFDFKARRYAAQFVIANQNKIINASKGVASILRDVASRNYQTPKRFVSKK